MLSSAKAMVPKSITATMVSATAGAFLQEGELVRPVAKDSSGS